MYKLILTLILLSLAAAAWQETPLGASVNMKEERMYIEYTVNRNEAVVKVHGESEQNLRSVDICDPVGKVLMKLQATSDEGVVSGFKLETRETTPEELFENCMEGRYDMIGETMDGARAQGSAVLSHELLPAPKILFPREGMVVPSRRLTIRWQPDAAAAGYMVCLEQDDNDGLMIHLPPGSSSLMVPPGVLKPGKQSFVEVGVLAQNGNCTIIEVEFIPR